MAERKTNPKDGATKKAKGSPKKAAGSADPAAKPAKPGPTPALGFSDTPELVNHYTNTQPNESVQEATMPNDLPAVQSDVTTPTLAQRAMTPCSVVIPGSVAEKLPDMVNTAAAKTPILAVVLGALTLGYYIYRKRSKADVAEAPAE